MTRDKFDRMERVGRVDPLRRHVHSERGWIEEQDAREWRQPPEPVGDVFGPVPAKLRPPPNPRRGRVRPGPPGMERVGGHVSS